MLNGEAQCPPSIWAILKHESGWIDLLISDTRVLLQSGQYNSSLQHHLYKTQVVQDCLGL